MNHHTEYKETDAANIRGGREQAPEAESLPGNRENPGGIDVLDTEGLQAALGPAADDFHLDVRDSVSSTNTLLKEQAALLPDWSVLAADHQTAGRGRRGRSFYSPSGTGIYMSVLLRPRMPAQESTRITTIAAAAACLAIEECTDSVPTIKWINDIFVGGRKVCGILTEASLDMESKTIGWAVMGIGWDVYPPEGGYPEEVKSVAGSIVTERRAGLRCRLAATFLKHFREMASDLEDRSYLEIYRKHCRLIGEDIRVLRDGQEIPARALDIDEECRLIVRWEDGSTEALSSGEVSVRPGAGI